MKIKGTEETHKPKTRTRYKSIKKETFNLFLKTIGNTH